MVTRWTPFTDMWNLYDTMNRFFEGAYPRSGAWTGTGTAHWANFPLNIYTRGDDLVVEALLPGVSPEDVQVAVERGVLMIAAKRHGWEEAGTEQGPTWYVREIGGGHFKRSISLPFPVDVDKAQASYSNGLLTLTLPKAEAARPKQIRIETAAPQQIEAGAAK